MNFNEAESYLYSLGNEVEAMKLGLENIRTLLAELGNPHEGYTKIQVAGTNGKGSVCAFLNSICLEAGIRTGLFTSPHLVSIAERIKIDGTDINEDELARFATLVRATAEQLLSGDQLEYRPTFFEHITAIALLAFTDAKVELAILETGLGGRLDATTAANAEICAITRIALDHQEYLGDTIEEIAGEKAAIIRPDSKVVLTHQIRAVEQVLEGRCRELNVEPKWASTSIEIKNEPEIAPAIFGSIDTDKAHYGKLELGEMLGKHQFQNAAVAISIAELLQEQGFAISTDEISIGIETAKHPGRLEYVGQFLFDGAHNVSGAKALLEYLDEFEKRPVTLIFGAMRGKNVAEMAEILFPKAGKIILTQPDNSRAIPPEELTVLVPASVNIDRVLIAGAVAEALQLAKKVSGEADLILVTGSLYLVGEVRKVLQYAG